MKTYLESHHLNVFVTLARTLNMSAAAKELGLTPSAISHALKVLESDLGYRIFERSPQHMALLPAGHRLLPNAEAILNQLQALRSKADGVSGKNEKGIRMGAPQIASPSIRTHILNRFQAHFPECSVQVDDHESKAGLVALAEGRIDLAITTEMALSTAIDFLFLGEDELRLIVHPRHDWAVKSWVSFNEVRQRHTTVPFCGGETLDWIKAAARQETTAFASLIEISREQAVHGLLNCTIEAAILPNWLVAEQLKCGRLTQVQLGRRATGRRWLLATRKNHPMNSAEAHLVNLCKGNLRELLRG